MGDRLPKRTVGSRHGLRQPTVSKLANFESREISRGLLLIGKRTLAAYDRPTDPQHALVQPVKADVSSVSYLGKWGHQRNTDSGAMEHQIRKEPIGPPVPDLIFRRRQK